MRAQRLMDICREFSLEQSRQAQLQQWAIILCKLERNIFVSQVNFDTLPEVALSQYQVPNKINQILSLVIPTGLCWLELIKQHLADTAELIYEEDQMRFQKRKRVYVTFDDASIFSLEDLTMGCLIETELTLVSRDDEDFEANFISRVNTNNVTMIVAQGRLYCTRKKLTKKKNITPLHLRPGVL